MKRKYITPKTRVPNAPANVIKAEYLQDWDILLTYDNGEKRVYICDDIPTSIAEWDQKLKDPEFFKNELKLNEYGQIYWEEDLECDEDGVYYVSVPYDEYIAEKPLPGGVALPQIIAENRKTLKKI